MKLRDLTGDIANEVEVDESSLDTQTAGGNFVKKNGMYAGTIERAFLMETKNGGYSCNIHIGGDSSYNIALFIINKDKKTKKLVIDGTFNGKTVKNRDAVNLLHLYYIATEKLVSVLDLPLSEEKETVEWKEYGKDKSEEVYTLPDLIGQKIQYSVTAKEQYAYDSEAEEDDKTAIKTNKDGDPIYKLNVLRFYGEDGKVPEEMIKGQESEQYEKDKTYVESDKAIKKVELEEPDFYEPDETSNVIDEDEPDF